MKKIENANLLRIFITELDKQDKNPLYESILFLARESDIAGVTILRGIMSYGKSNIIHTSKILDIFDNLPLVIEIVDEEIKIKEFKSKLNSIMEKANCGALITVEKIEAEMFLPHSK